MLSADVERTMRRNQDNDVLFKAVRNFVSKFRERKLIKKDNQKPKQILVGHTKSGINVFKAKISDALGCFFHMYHTLISIQMNRFF